MSAPSRLSGPLCFKTSPNTKTTKQPLGFCAHSTVLSSAPNLHAAPHQPPSEPYPGLGPLLPNTTMLNHKGMGPSASVHPHTQVKACSAFRLHTFNHGEGRVWLSEDLRPPHRAEAAQQLLILCCCFFFHPPLNKFSSFSLFFFF